MKDILNVSYSEYGKYHGECNPTPVSTTQKYIPGAPDTYESKHTEFTVKTVLEAFDQKEYLTREDIERHLKGKVLGRDCIYDSLAVLVSDKKIKVKKFNGSYFYVRT